jgi:hypothetical protein
MTAANDSPPGERRGKRASDRAFGLVMAGFFALVGLWPVVVGHGPRPWAVAVAVAFLAAAGLCPARLAPLHRGWLWLGERMHRIVSPIVLGLVYLLAVVPTGLLLRALGKDPMRRGFEPERESYWIERTPPGPDPSQMRQQF